MRDRPLYTLLFAAAMCTVCALAVSTFAVRLGPRIESNRALDRQKKVLVAAGLLSPGDAPSAADIRSLFHSRVDKRIVELETGASVPLRDEDHALLAGRRPAPANSAGLPWVPTHAQVYLVSAGHDPAVIVLPVEGKGLWSTMRGFLALDAVDPRLVRGLEFYEHGETPGLGGEIDNPRWKAQWKGRFAFDDRGHPALHVARGKVGPPAEYPHGVDAISGATLTARGVTGLLRYWLGDHGFGPYLKRIMDEGGAP